VPYFGICLGLQILFEGSDEGGAPGLGLLPGRVVRLPEGARDPATSERLKIPHMGWNALEGVDLPGLAEGDHVYFVHSYHARPADDGCVAAWATHGVRFAAAVRSGSLLATQFHPEKSGPAGLAVLDLFARQSP
jgi:glutamine amidotransferase